MSAATNSYYTAYVEIDELKRRVRIIIIIITYHHLHYYHLHYYHYLVSRLVIQLLMLAMPQNEWWLRSTREW